MYFVRRRRPAAPEMPVAAAGISHREFLQSALDAAGQWTRYADPKALGVLVLLGLGLTDLISQSDRFVRPHAAPTSTCSITDSHGHTCIGLAATGAFIVAAGIAVLVVMCVTVALFSRLSLHGVLGNDDDGSAPRSRYYFGEVRRYSSQAAYVQSVLTQSEDALLREMAEQVYQVSKICHRKHAWTQRAYLLSVAFLMAWACGRILLAVH